MSMRHNLWLSAVIMVLALLMPLTVPAQTESCKDTAEHIRLRQAMWNACGGESTRDVYEAAKAYQAHANKEDDLDSYYNAWVCGIVYSLDHMNISDAYHITQTMKTDLLTGRGGKDEQFLAPNMLGQVYNACGNVSGAITEFKKAVELIKGTKYEATGLSTLYLGMAHIYINSKLEQAMHWIEMDIQEVERHHDSDRYYRNMANAHAFKAMIYFKLHDYDQFWACQRKARDFQEKNTTGSTGSFLPYLDIYQMALEGHGDEALEAAGKLPNQKDRYIVKCDVLRYLGRGEEAFKTQRKLMHIRDSITGLTIAENIEKLDEELRLVKAEQSTTRRANIVLTIAVVLALVIIGLLIRSYYYRRKYQRLLLAKNHDLVEANRRVTAADMMKTEFMRGISHEIRTPLNIINGFTQVLTDDMMAFDPEERKNIASTISENTKHITSLVNKMLKLANENSKDLLGKIEEIDARDICRRAIQGMPAINPAEVKVEFEDLTQGDGLCLYTNGDSLLLMLNYMLENSAKFTEKGFIRLILRHDDSDFYFTVEDTGCGISEDKKDHIFERFMKGDDFKEGLGLGLAYCYETAQKLGGTLALDHTSEAGTAFTLSLPIKLKTNKS